ncbi:MAG: hypothetical protein R3E14_12105 [Erythrobacter sp.]
MLVTADSRAILTDALERRLSGQASGKIADAIPCPASLSQLEKSAWLALQNWSSDEVLRESFASHAEYSRNRLKHLLQVLQ